MSTVVPEWQAMKDAQEAGVDVVAIANPCSGPGTEEDRPSYELGMEALNNSGVEVVGYIATGYGKLPIEQVKDQIDLYKDWYGQWVTGIFLDETVEEADEVSEGDRGMCKRYKGYHNHIKDRFGRSALVICNTGTMATEEVLIRSADDDVVWCVLENSRSYMEQNFGKCTFGMARSRGEGSRDKPVVGTPPAAPRGLRGKAAFLVHGASNLSPEELSHWAFQLRDGGWSHIFMTDRFFVPESKDPKLLNPWNGLPKYWSDMVRAVAAVNLDEANFRSKPRGRCCSCF